MWLVDVCCLLFGLICCVALDLGLLKLLFMLCLCIAWVGCSWCLIVWISCLLFWVYWCDDCLFCWLWFFVLLVVDWCLFSCGIVSLVYCCFVVVNLLWVIVFCLVCLFWFVGLSIMPVVWLRWCDVMDDVYFFNSVVYLFVVRCFVVFVVD